MTRNLEEHVIVYGAHESNEEEHLLSKIFKFLQA